jgi:hypothetical protein
MKMIAKGLAFLLVFPFVLFARDANAIHAPRKTGSETVEQRLSKAIKATRELAPQGITVNLGRGGIEPDLPPDRGTDGRIGLYDASKARFPRHQDVMPYLEARPWSLSYIVEHQVRPTIPPTIISSLTNADAKALRKLLKDADPAIRGLAAEALAGEQKQGEERLRSAVAEELMLIALPANWEFLKAQFFRKPVISPGAAPAPRWTILRQLDITPLTAEKRTALIDLLTDNRCDVLIATDVTSAWGLFRPAVDAVNAYAGKTLVPNSVFLK